MTRHAPLFRRLRRPAKLPRTLAFTVGVLAFASAGCDAAPAGEHHDADDQAEAEPSFNFGFYSTRCDEEDSTAPELRAELERRAREVFPALASAERTAIGELSPALGSDSPLIRPEALELYETFLDSNDTFEIVGTKHIRAVRQKPAFDWIRCGDVASTGEENIRIRAIVGAGDVGVVEADVDGKGGPRRLRIQLRRIDEVWNLVLWEVTYRAWSGMDTDQWHDFAVASVPATPLAATIGFTTSAVLSGADSSYENAASIAAYAKRDQFLATPTARSAHSGWLLGDRTIALAQVRTFATTATGEFRLTPQLVLHHEDLDRPITQAAEHLATQFVQRAPILADHFTHLTVQTDAKDDPQWAVVPLPAPD